MTFIHDSPNFPDLLNLVADNLAAQGVELAPSLVEKDYWITHVLWALQGAGLEVSFKGGTSLSKAFRIIHRFSEDLDLRIAQGTIELPPVSSWRSDGKTASAERRAFFQALAALELPAVKLFLDEESMGKEAFGAYILADYPGRFKEGLPTAASPFIKLEIGEARVHPGVVMPISSWVHDHVVTGELQDRFVANHVQALNCVHPAVTLVEKLDAVRKRFINPDRRAKAFVRHYEDAAHIVRSLGTLPPMAGFHRVEELFLEMRKLKLIGPIPDPSNPAFNPDGSERWEEVAQAHTEIAPLFWGPRIALAEAAKEIREFLGGLGPEMGFPKVDSAKTQRTAAPDTTPSRPKRH